MGIANVRDSCSISIEAPSKAPKPSHRRCSSWWSILTSRDNGRLRKAYAISENVTVRILDAGVGTKPDDAIHEVCVYEQMFKAGICLPFLPKVQELLSKLGLVL